MTNLPDPRADETDVSLRPLLFSIAYRMTGSVSDAEDLVQETMSGCMRQRAMGPRSSRGVHMRARSFPDSPSTTCVRPGCVVRSTSENGCPSR